MMALLLMILLVTPTFASEPNLTLRFQSHEFVFTRSELLKHPALENITVVDPNYGFTPHTYQALRISVLLSKFPDDPETSIVFKTSDGYSKIFTRRRLLESSPATPYLAIEPSQEKWEPIFEHPVSPGPFYLVWVRGENITTSEWPYQVTLIESKEPLSKLYPKILPSPDLMPGNAIQRGFSIYKQYCMNCHSMNGEGGGELGPDLNVPSNPTEYFTEAALRRYIRNPIEVKAVPGSRMPSYPKEVISDDDLDALVAYLKHMASRR